MDEMFRHSAGERHDRGDWYRPGADAGQ